MNTTRKFLLSGLLLPLLVSACSGLTRSDKPATKTWWLKPLTGVSQKPVPVKVTKVDLSVRVVPGLDGQYLCGSATLVASYTGFRADTG